MKNQINISNLTPEEIEEVRQQLKALDEQPKSIMDKVKSWKDATDIVMPTYWVSSIGRINNGSEYDESKSKVPSEKHALSILATSQLMVIAEALNEGFVFGINQECREYFISYDPCEKELVVNYALNNRYTQILFKSKELAEHTINQFPELWYDYFMIDKPE